MEATSAYEVVREHYQFPFELRPYQQRETNNLSEFDRAGYYWEPGSGKTAASTHYALYFKIRNNVPQWLVLMPPILLRQWHNWLLSVKDKKGEPLSVTTYYGAPKERKKLDLNSDFILTTYGMLKNDFEYLSTFFAGRDIGVIADEATAIKNIASQTHQAVRDFAVGRPCLLLTGTPITKPEDAYAYIKLIAPSIYRNKNQFDRLHIDQTDDYGNVRTWKNLDLLADNMKVQTSRIIRREVQAELPAIIYNTVPYDLHVKHMKLYRLLAEERLVELAAGGEINALSANALRAMLQQIVLNWAHFAEDESLRPSTLDLVDEVMEEIGEGKKLALVAHFRMSNAYLQNQLGEKYGAVCIYGETSKSNRQKALDSFIENVHCRMIILQPSAAGFGVDGLQHVCSDMLVLEAPPTAPALHQVVARLDRDGQKEPVNCRIAVAQGTAQVRLFKNLLENDTIINRVQGGYQDLRDSIYGV